jgi:SIS domain
MSLMKFSTMASATMALAVLGLQLPADAQSRPTRETPAAAAVARKADIAAKERINAWTVGLAGGFIEGAPLRLAAEIARVVNEQDKLHVIPIVTQGATENVNSLLYLRGVDAAIINTGALDEYNAKAHGQRILSLVNVPSSTMARGSQIVLPTLAGPQVGVASTKAFTCQLATLACLAVAAGRDRGVLSADDEVPLVRALADVPSYMTCALELEPKIRSSLAR